jgi:hypothetical protein
MWGPVLNIVGHMLNVNRCMIGIYAPRLWGRDDNPFYHFIIYLRYYLLHAYGRTGIFVPVFAPLHC